MRIGIPSEDTLALATRLGQLLLDRKLMVVTAESCTGGMIAGAITDVAGSSAWFDRGFVTYSNEAKMEMLGVSAKTLGAYGAVSDATVREMVAGALRNSRATLAAAVTGIAGPAGGTPTKPVGLVWLGWGHREGSIDVLAEHFAEDRAAVRAATVRRALEGLIERASAV